MFFSSRLPEDTRPNALAQLLDRLKREAVPILDLTASNPTQAGFDYPPDLLAPLGAAGSLKYEPDPAGLLSARRAVSLDFARRGLSVPPEQIVLTASTSEAYSILFKLLCDAGDAVLVPVPSYPLFDHLTRLDAIETLPYPLNFHGRWTVDVDAIDRAVTPRTRALLAVNPNNPTGSYVSAAELDRIRELCRARGLALVGDEVFADYPLDPAHATSVLDSERILTFGLGGLSKSVGLPQVKLGWIGVRGPREEVCHALERLEIISDAYLSVSTPVQREASWLLERGALVRVQIQERVAANLARLRRESSRHPSVEILPCEGGWSAVLRVPRIATEDELVTRLLGEQHVLVHPGYFFDFPGEAYLVVSLLPEPPVFERAVERVFAVAACG